MVKAGLLNRFLFISGGTHLVTAGCAESSSPIARLFHILNHKDDRTRLSIGCHGLLYKRTLFSLTELSLVVCALSHKAVFVFRQRAVLAWCSRIGSPLVHKAFQ